MRGRATNALLALAAVIGTAGTSFADEGGVSFWLPGAYGSLAATPAQPGWSLGLINFFTSISASGAVAAAREVEIGRFNPTVNVNLNANLSANADYVLIDPSYAFATPVFGGQLGLEMIGVVARNNVDLSGTLTTTAGPFVVTRQGSIDDGRTGFGDLYPRASLRWNSGVNNFMIYGMGDIPVGDYNSTNLANIGMGHGAVDGGAGYTYFNPQTGQEFSVVSGLTYNLINPSTGYRNGDDWHVDWGISQFLSKQLLVGLVGYYYQQVTPDSGCVPMLCPFESRVAAIGPQVGFVFPAGSTQVYLNVKGYREFDASDRPSGWNAWVTLSLSPSPPTPPTSPRPMITK